jgi:hypothetical protein
MLSSLSCFTPFNISNADFCVKDKYDFDFFVGIVWLVILYFYYKIILGKTI